MSDEAATETIDFLVVDNQAERRATITASLDALRPGRSLSVASGQAARDALLAQQVGFVISATTLPRMTGIELLRFIRRAPLSFDLPVLMLLEQEEEEKILFAKEEGADHVLCGEINTETLRGAIATIRNQRQRRTPTQKALLIARRLFLQREYQQAIDKTMQIEGVATNREAMQLLCECYYRQKNLEKAQQYLKKIISPPNSKTLHLLSKVCLAENQCGDAIAHLTKANLLYPSSLDLKIDLGKLYLSLGMTEQAKGQFDTVLADSPSDLNLIKMGKACLARGMVAEAALFLNKAEQPIPETAYIFAELAMALESAADLTEAAAQYEKCLRLMPNNPTFLLNLSKLYLKTDRRDQAQNIINKLHQRFPDNEKINQILAYLQAH